MMATVDNERVVTPLNERILASLREVLGEGKHPLHEPSFSGEELLYLKECIASTYVSSVGPFVDRFERELAEYTGSRRAVAVVNGTSALQVALKLAGVKPGDEVLMPALTFVGTANAATYLGATPHFADSSPSTLGLDPEALKDWLKHVVEMTSFGARNRFSGSRISAVVPMHTFGHPCDIEKLIILAKDYRLELVEDAAESLGSYVGDRHTGTFGCCGILSFNGNKVITTGGGGAILTNNNNLADYAKHLTSTAKVSHRWDFVHDEVGYNFRMPNLNAALGCAQLDYLPQLLDSKRGLTELYTKAFASIREVTLMREPNGCRSNYWLQALILDDSVADQRDVILETTNDCGFSTRPAWLPIHRLPPYEACARAPLPVTESLRARIINLPSTVRSK